MLPNVLQPSATDHVPVLANEVRESLGVQPGATVVDGTFGAGGHATILAAELQGRGKLIAIDRDPTARTYFERFEKRSGVPARLLSGDFGVVLPQLAANGVRADAILLDLGVSSMQLDRPERGFSYSVDAPLDMRMDTSQDLTAAEIVNEWPEHELVTIFRRYGEERYSKQIARAIVRRLTRGRWPAPSQADLTDWKYVAFLRGDPDRRANDMICRRIARLPPGEIAGLSAALPYLHAAELIRLLPDHAAAEVLAVLAPERQVQVFEELGEEQASDLLALLAPDAATDS